VQGIMMQSRKLNQDIIAAAKSRDDITLVRLVESWWSEFDAVNAATAFRSLLMLHHSSNKRSEVLRILEKEISERHMPAFGARQCANTLHALAKAKRSHSASILLLQLLLERVAELVHDLNPQDISNIMWAFATLELEAEPLKELVSLLAAQALSVHRDFNPQSISNTLWAFATLGLQPGSNLVSAMTARAVMMQYDFNPQAIGNTLWALATLGLKPSKHLEEALSEQALVVQNEFNTQNISNTLWAFATRGDQPDKKLVSALTAQVSAHVSCNI